jgi:hypothetical protein
MATNQKNAEENSTMPTQANPAITKKPRHANLQNVATSILTQRPEAKAPSEIAELRSINFAAIPRSNLYIPHHPPSSSLRERSRTSRMLLVFQCHLEAMSQLRVGL